MFKSIYLKIKGNYQKIRNNKKIFKLLRRKRIKENIINLLKSRIKEKEKIKYDKYKIKIRWQE